MDLNQRAEYLAETYAEKGEYALAKDTLEKIPEIYFTKLQLEAKLLKGEDMFAPAQNQKDISAEMLVDMFLVLADYYEEKGEHEVAANQLETAKKVIEALKDDYNDGIWSETFYQYYGESVLKKIEEKLKK